MFERDHRLHYANRAAHAAGLGERARNPKIAALHHELARLYWMFAVTADRPRSDLMAVGDEGRDDPPAPIEPRLGRAFRTAARGCPQTGVNGLRSAP